MYINNMHGISPVAYGGSSYQFSKATWSWDPSRNTTMVDAAWLQGAAMQPVRSQGALRKGDGARGIGFVNVVVIKNEDRCCAISSFFLLNHRVGVAT
jgi:hypothetical protein